jgi:predicted kinase
MLIGVPASGKSTWIKNQDWADKCVVVSTDKYVEEYAKHAGKTYSEVFNLVMSDAVAAMVDSVILARSMQQDIIWDQTSTTVASRKKKFDMLPEYEVIAVYFRTPNRDELDVRLSGRPGKHIPKNVVDSMIENLEEPTEEEGFKEIWMV